MGEVEEPLDAVLDAGEHPLSEDEFTRQAERLRGELLAHCYRMLGSVQEAEDQVQETYLRAWRAFHAFEGRSSVRTWLYRIATRCALTALAGRERRPLPMGLGTPSSDPAGELDERREIPWLEPIPDARVQLASTDPEQAARAEESIRLAFVAALHTLTPRQRAVLLLRDVLGFSASEAAETLGMTFAAANSALQRARARVEELHARERIPARDLGDAQRALLERYVRAFEAYDTDAVVALLCEDATWEMPPFASWYSGAAAIGALVRTHCPASAAGDLRLLPTTANSQPAFAVYLRGADGVHRAFQLHVLELAMEGARGLAVAHVSCFFDTALFAAFELPLELHAAPTSTPAV